MAKQINRHIKLAGTIDDISFYKSQDGYLARAKGGVSGERIKSDPRFKNTRLNGREFGASGKAAKFFRKVVNNEMRRAGDNRAASRVTQVMSRILKSDPNNDWGDRKVSEGDLTLLKGFEFNLGVSLAQALKPDLGFSIDRVTGQVAVQVPALTPAIDIAAPADSTHFNIFAAAMAIDFDAETASLVRANTVNLPWDNQPLAAASLAMNLPANSTVPILLLVGIEFLIIVNGNLHNQSKGASALQLAVVDLPA
ncbi:hypothetical protein [Paraflavitalea pollutisoli]|uniref:hypothetical protein n=1 Tax=Paraflavitalea pollutisoli TaxID=3034143 RepID=UPI0023EB6142|nr:hypothetical protein [Paraflavitalea sp. H1-2-19X]